jgi:hypothetical protein
MNRCRESINRIRERLEEAGYGGKKLGKVG